MNIVKLPGFMMGTFYNSSMCFPTVCIASFIIIFPDVLPTILLTSPKQWNTSLSSHSREMRGIIMNVEIPVKTCFYWKSLVVHIEACWIYEDYKKKSKHTGKQMHFFIQNLGSPTFKRQGESEGIFNIHATVQKSYILL